MEELDQIVVDDDMNSDYSAAKEGETHAEKCLEDKSEHTAENYSDIMDVFPEEVNSGHNMETSQNFGEDYASTSKSRVVVRRRKTDFENSKRLVLPRKSKTKAIESIQNIAKGIIGMKGSPMRAGKKNARKRLRKGVERRYKKSPTKIRRAKTMKKTRRVKKGVKSRVTMKDSGLSLLSSGNSSYATSMTHSVCSRCRY